MSIIMQNKESRLIQAAKRTVRAEATLVIIIIVIAAWSTYALYKLSVGADSIFGFTFSKSSTSTSNQEQNSASNLSSYLQLQNFANPDSSLDKVSLSNHSQRDSELRYRNHLIQELLRGQRELHANLGQAFPGSTGLSSPAGQVQSKEYISKVNADNLRALANYMSENSPLKNQLDQQQLRLQIASKNPWLHQIHYSNGTHHPMSGEGLPEISSTLNPVATLNQQYSRFEPTDLAELNKIAIPSNDREAAESSRDPSESIIETQNSSADYESPEASDASSSSNADTNGSEGEGSSSDSDEDNYNVESNPQIESDPTNGSQEQSDESSESENPTQADEETAKDDSQSIDEEVDRMTQPSSGVALQQDRPFDYKNTVQFDDTLITNNNSLDLPSKLIPPGNLIARFASPNRTKDSSLKKILSLEARDLEVDHNSPISLNNLDNSNPREEPDMQNRTKQVKKEFSIRRHNKQQLRQELSAKETKNMDKDITALAENDKTTVHSRTREKRSVFNQKVEKIRAPYEIDGYLDSIDFESFIDLPSSDDSVVVKVISSENAGKGKNSSKKLVPDPTPTSFSQQVKTKGNKSISSRLFDPDFLESAINYRHLLNSPNYSYPAGSYLTSNETSVNELLKQKKLLDELALSQLPSPIYGNNNSIHEPRASASLNHVDINRLLPMAASDDHQPKVKKKSSYMLKKKKQHDHMDARKKSSSGHKKGGHKEKKLKKEEKKYLKEKRFKGAKKGKKVSKGKGGAGGKKGKKLYKDRGYKKKGFKNVAHKEEWGHKKSYFDEFRDKDFKKKWKKFDDKYNYAQMKKFQAKDEKGAKRLKHHDEKFKKFDNGRWKNSYHKQSKEHKESSKKDKKHKKKSNDDFD